MKEGLDMDVLCDRMRKAFPGATISMVDGLRLDFENERKWVSLRKSNTEPILRIYSEAPDKSGADDLASQILALLSL